MCCITVLHRCAASLRACRGLICTRRISAMIVLTEILQCTRCQQHQCRDRHCPAPPLRQKAKRPKARGGRGGVVARKRVWDTQTEGPTRRKCMNRCRCRGTGSLGPRRVCAARPGQDQHGECTSPKGYGASMADTHRHTDQQLRVASGACARGGGKGGRVWVGGGWEMREGEQKQQQ